MGVYWVVGNLDRKEVVTPQSAGKYNHKAGVVSELVEVAIKQKWDLSKELVLAVNDCGGGVIVTEESPFDYMAYLESGAGVGPDGYAIWETELRELQATYETMCDEWTEVPKGRGNP